MNLDIHYEDENISQAYKLLDSISSNLKSLKKLIIRLGRSDKFEFSEKQNIIILEKQEKNGMKEN